MESNNGKDEIVINDLRNEGPTSRLREGTRQSLAFRLLWLMSAIAAAISFGVIFRLIDISVAKDLGIVLYAPTLSVFAIIVGFFFGEGTAR